jgi:hypothetical protein
MGDHRRNTEAGQRHGPRDRTATDGARRALSLRAEDWSSDRVLDPGDSHDKGEQSLCVGEAA